jgi:hypothetical protein
MQPNQDFDNVSDAAFIAAHFPELLDIKTTQFVGNWQEIFAIERAFKMLLFEFYENPDAIHLVMKRSCNIHETIVANWLIDRFTGEFVFVPMNSRCELITYLTRINGEQDTITVYDTDDVKFTKMLGDAQEKLRSLEQTYVELTEKASAAECEARGHHINYEAFTSVNMPDVAEEEMEKFNELTLIAGKHNEDSNVYLEKITQLKEAIDKLQA